MAGTPAEELATKFRSDYERDGVVIIRNAIPKDQVEGFRKELEDVFMRKTRGELGTFTDMTKAAEKKRDQGIPLLENTSSGPMGNGKYLTEIEAGRHHKGIRNFEHFSHLPAVVGALLGTKELRFYGDHIFLKEPGSKLQTGFHQDAPYFPWDGDQAAVCWVPVDSVSKENGAMRYVKGSHKWAQLKPQLLITKEAANPENSALDVPTEAELYANHEVLSWDAEPGDVIIHHPNTVHGSFGNASLDKRRLAASIRYVGDDVRWQNKDTNVGLGESLMRNWAPGNENLVGENMMEERVKGLPPLSAMDADMKYMISSALVYVEMQSGESMDARECAREAFPIVWRQNTRSSRL